MLLKFWTTDEGSASIEFITIGMLLTVPLVYLVLALAQLQAGVLVSEGAARNAARTVAMHGSAGIAGAEATTTLALADAGLEGTDAEMTIDCGATGCDAASGAVTVTVEIVVPLPLVPPVLNLDTALGIPVSASVTQPVSEHFIQRSP